jgi:hypothetical protein
LDKNGNPCDGQHIFEKIPVTVSSFLAERRITKKRIGRLEKGVNDLFAEWLAYVNNH